MVKSGRLKADAAIALGMVMMMPDATAIEMGQEAAFQDGEPTDGEKWRQKIGRRLPELERTCKCGHEVGQHQGIEAEIRDVCVDCKCLLFTGLIKRSGQNKIGKRWATTWRAN